MSPVNIIVDANIIFSGILKTNGLIGDLLINSVNEFHFIAPDFLRQEIRKHERKLSALSGLSIAMVRESEYYISRDITYISTEQIDTSYFERAEELVADIDPKDAEYIAYAMHFHCKLWSGDKALASGLKKKGYKEIISTQELAALRETLRRKN